MKTNGNGVRQWNRYPEYKDSGIGWLGEVPSHWEVHRLKHLACVKPSNVDKKTVEAQQPVRLCNYVDVYKNEYITPEITFMHATATPNQIQDFALRAGDVLITKDSESWEDIAVPAYVASDNGNRITYTTGALENPLINRKVVDVLEGTRPAFDNREKKYHTFDDVAMSPSITS